MKTLIQLICAMSVLFVSAQAVAGENEAYLRRVSLLLTGTPPMNEDLKPIAAMNDAQFEAYLQSKIDLYMQSPLFVEKMRIRLLELFQMKISSHTMPKMEERGFNVNINDSGAFDNFIEDLISKNQSWDNLLLGNSYRLDSNKVDELDFFQDVLNMQTGNTAGKDLLLTPKDAQSNNALAGILTTPRFFDRFFNTKLNENRKRAAAVFRVFLCDKMQPVLLVSDEERTELMMKAMNLSGPQNRINVPTTANPSARHGTDPSCQSCHYKLDPLGKAFATSGARPNIDVSPGSLTFKDAAGLLVSKPYQNMRELGVNITSQPEYVRCQTQHFWNWFVGEDTKVSDSSNLMQKFTELGRKPKDFIKYVLVSQRKVSRGIKENDIRFSQVKPIFDRCNTCHASQPLAPELNIPTSWKQDTGLAMLSEVLRDTDLDGKIGRSRMPPARAGWTLEGRDRELLKAWIKSGAKLDDGTSAYKVADSAFQNMVSDIHPNSAEFVNRPTFNNTSSRMLQNFDFLESVRMKLGLSADDLQMFSDCKIDDNEKKALGFMDPATGQRPASAPALVYYQTINSCLSNLYNNSYTRIFDIYPNTLWAKLNDAEKSNRIRQVMDQALGTNVVDAATFARLEPKLMNYIQTNKPQSMLPDAMKAAFFYLLLMPEFLSY